VTDVTPAYDARMPPEKVRLRIGNLAKAVLVTGQAYQDPKDALNEFVSNAADDYAQAGRAGARIRVVLRRKGRHPMIAVDDAGRGMSPERLREVARSLFESSKVGDARTIGEKAIGILAYQQLGGRCDIVSRAHDSGETWALRLVRGSATAQLERERRRARVEPGTTVYLGDLDPDVLRLLTQRKVVDYLRARRAAALTSRAYELEVVEGRSSEFVRPEKPDGIKLDIPAQPTLWGRIEFGLYVAPADGSRRRVAVVGRAGTTIIDDLGELDEFAGAPWISDQVAGLIVFEALQQSAGRRAILRDREAFPVFLDAVRAIKPAVARAVERVTEEVDTQTADRLAETVRKIFGRVLKELADLDNPMRTQFGSTPGTGGLLEAHRGSGTEPLEPAPPASNGHGSPYEPPPVDDLIAPSRDPIAPPTGAQPATPDRRRSSALPSVEPDPTPGDARSRFDGERGVVLYNERHGDYLLVKNDEAALLDYLATLVAKEYVLYNNARAHPEDFSEEMVRMLVRVRRHLPRRR
jgi:Histidine kinase-, DNA gyrase B-, and HSP90-like ATPase